MAITTYLEVGVVLLAGRADTVIEVLSSDVDNIIEVKERRFPAVAGQTRVKPVFRPE